MALATNALTNVATMESILGLASGSADAVLQRCINQASAIAESYAGREFYRGTVTEKHPGQAGPIIVLRRPPVNSITSVTYVGGTAEGSSTYEIHDANLGGLYRVSGNWVGEDWTYRDSSRTPFLGQGRLVWTIVYDGGWYTPKQDDDGAGTRTLPYDIEAAAIQIATAIYRAEGRDPTLRAESLMEASQTYGATSGVGSADWLDSVVPGAAATLRRYRRGLMA